MGSDLEIVIRGINSGIWALNEIQECFGSWGDFAVGCGCVGNGEMLFQLDCFRVGSLALAALTLRHGYEYIRKQLHA